MKKKLSAFFLMLSCASVVFAQNRVITGKVTDQKDGSPLPGVSVTTKEDPGLGTQTNTNGAYAITVPANATTLVFRYIGYKTANAPITGSVVNVEIAEDAKQLTEVVVVGYGTQKRANLTGSITTVTGKAIENTPVTSFEQALQGRTAGVNIQSNGGKLGQGIKIGVRGIASISAGTQPLVVVDGIIINTENLSLTDAATNPLADINFNDVETFDILKDASASAIYGARASNGVILITTKKGKAGESKVSLNTQFGFSQPSRHRKFLNPAQFIQIEQRAGLGAAKQDFLGQGLDPSDPEYESLAGFIADYKDGVTADLQGFAAGSSNLKKYNTDWEKQAFQSAPQQQYDLNINGGNDKTTYFISGQALNQAGLVKGNHYQRYSGRVNVDSKVFKTFEVGMNLNFIHSYNQRVSDDDQFNTPLEIVALSPITPIYDPRHGNAISGTPPYSSEGNYGSFPLYYNPLLSVGNAYYHTNIFHTIGNIFANWDIVNHLTFHSDIGVDQTNQNEDSYKNSITQDDTGTPNGFGENSNTTVVNYTFNNYFTYKNTFAQDHNVEIVAGTSYEYYHFLGNDVQGKEFPSDAYKTIKSAASISAGSSSQESYVFLSYFARANYNYKSKYLLTLSVRDDASSRFGANNRYGLFPAGSVGWVLTEEEFLKNSNTLSNLKLRASYGLTGNAEIGNYAALGLFQGDAGYNGVAGQRAYQIANPNLKWEKTAQIDLAVDFGFFNNRLSGSVDVYKKNTRDLLLDVAIPETTGFQTQTQNLGKLYNKGVELELSSENFVGKFRWGTSLNISYNKNVVTYTNGQIININSSNLNRVVEGQPVGVFYGPEYAGVDPANGDALYYLNTKNPNGSLNKGKTNDYNSAQAVPLGNPTPPVTAGITNNFSYKGFDLSFTFQGAFGNKIFNEAGQYMSSNASNGYDNQTIDQLAYWDKPGDITNVPEPRLFEPNGTSNSSRYLQGGSYVRLKTLTLGYTIPKEFLSKIRIDHARVFVNAYNLFIITKYTGWDPEVNADFSAESATRNGSSLDLGNDFYSVPQPRTITFGLNIGL